MIRILLAQQGGLVRGAIASVLSNERDLEVVAEAGDQHETAELTPRERPDVLVLDHALPGAPCAGELCRTLCEKLPELRVLIMADRRGTGWVAAALARFAPRVGVLATDAPPPRLVEGVRQIVSGWPVFDTELMVAALTAQDSPFTNRERAVLRMAVHGTPVRDIATELVLSAGTVRNHLSRVVTKTGARTRIEAIRIAQESGWI